MNRLFANKNIFFELLIIFMLVLMFHNYLNDWVSEWSNFDSFYAFGFFSLAFIGYFLKENYVVLKNIEKKPSAFGIVFLFIGLLVYVVGIRADYSFMTSLALPMFIFGIILSLYGKKMIFKLLIPIILFTFSLPIFPLHRITMPLQLFSAQAAHILLSSLGVPAHHEGSLLLVGNYRLSVEPGCSGLKSVSSLFFISLIYTYFIKSEFTKKIFFVAASIPLALFMNILRLTFSGFYALYNGYHGLLEFHDGVGIVGYIISIGIIILFARFIENKTEEKSP